MRSLPGADIQASCEPWLYLPCFHGRSLDRVWTVPMKLLWKSEFTFVGFVFDIWSLKTHPCMQEVQGLQTGLWLNYGLQCTSRVHCFMRTCIFKWTKFHVSDLHVLQYMEQWSTPSRKLSFSCTHPWKRGSCFAFQFTRQVQGKSYWNEVPLSWIFQVPWHTFLTCCMCVCTNRYKLLDICVY